MSQVRHVDRRTMQRTGKTRLRFYDCHREQLEVVLAALEKARNEGETQHDTRALELICAHYLANG